MTKVLKFYRKKKDIATCIYEVGHKRFIVEKLERNAFLNEEI